ncbi:MAG: hypothetical protein IT535_14155 [Bauldia sp.]|nr:hypothetical protein [Bauldia sp.]
MPVQYQDLATDLPSQSQLGGLDWQANSDISGQARQLMDTEYYDQVRRLANALSTPGRDSEHALAAARMVLAQHGVLDRSTLGGPVDPFEQYLGFLSSPHSRGNADVSVPNYSLNDEAANRILDEIAKPESGGQYNIMVGEVGSPENALTAMTLDQLRDFQDEWLAANGDGTAAGRYQIVQGTLNSLINILNLDPNEMFDKGMQDRLALELMRGRDFDSWVAGEISDEDFANLLAKEWASLPIVTDDVADSYGRTGRRGISYYAGVGNNAALVTPEEILAALADARSLLKALPVPRRRP